MESEATDLEKKIIKQIEYYFGDCNLPRDRFLQEQIKEDDGWVTFETMLKFNRLHQLSKDVDVVLAALKKSTSGLMEISEDGTKLRRSPDKPLPDNDEEHKKNVAARSVYAKEFPLDTSLDSLEEFFQTFGEVESIVKRKDIKKCFKGSVFVTFKSEEAVKKFLEAESVKFKDVELEKRLTKDDYFKQKGEEKKKIQGDKKKKKEQATNRQRQDEGQKVENEMPKGAILNLKGMKAGTSREEIKNMLQDYGCIAWVDFDKGDPECFVRYDQENKATEVLAKVLEAMNGEITLNDAKLEARVLEGEEEVAKWKQMYNDMTERHSKKFSRNSRKKGRFGKRPSKKTREALKAKNTSGGGDDNDDDGGDDDEGGDNAGDAAGDEEPPVKKTKVEVNEEPEEANGD